MRELHLKAPAIVVADYFHLFVNRRAYTLQSNRPHPESARHYYYRPKDRKTGLGLGLTPDTIRRHLEGEITIGLYAINPAIQCSKWVAIDADYEDSLTDLLKLSFHLRQDGVESALEKSHRGGHLWIFMAEPLPARDCRIYVCGLALRLCIPVKGGRRREGIEVFPKHDALKPGRYGNAIRGPLGIHRGAAQRFWFNGADADLEKQRRHRMSKYGLTQTVLREEKYLVEALKGMGYEVEVHPEGAQLNSYCSEQEAKVANIVIRRQHLRGAYGDIGFARQPDGQLAVIKDELDEYRGYGARWLGRVQQLYKEKQTLAMARAKGYTLKGREVIDTSKGKQVRLQFVARR